MDEATKETICDNIYIHPRVCKTQEELDTHCDKCQLGEETKQVVQT